MFKDFNEIFKGVKKTLKLLHKKEKFLLILATILMLGAGILVNLPAVILGKFVDKMINSQISDFSIALPYLYIIIIVIVFKEVLTIFRKYLVENIATQTEKKQTVAVVNRILKVDIESFISKYQIGSLHGKMSRSIDGLVKMIKLSFLDFLPVLFSAIAALVIVFLQKPILASFMILVVPAGLFIIIKQISSQKGIRIALLRRKEEIDGKVVEMLGGIQTIRVSNTVEREVNKVSEITEEIRKKEIKHHIWMAFYDALKYFNESFFYILVVGISIYFSTKGIISRGDILTYSILFMSVTGPLREIHRILDEAHESSIRVNDLDELLSEPIDVSFSNNGLAKNSLVDNILEVRSLSFKYSGNKEKVLNNINLNIRRGEKIGIAGYSGCGKSSFIKILLRLVHGYDGEIKFLGGNLQSLSRQEIANRIAYVPQSTYIFSGTIRENIKYGCRENVNDADVIKAAKKANIYDEIISGLGGLNGRVSENGNNLSGGQKQRLAIARLILKSPDILIFDEATSALDNINESIVQKNISEIFPEKTIITVAHRLTTLENMDRILVFDSGKIVQEGTFNKLANIEGKFKEFLKHKN